MLGQGSHYWSGHFYINTLEWFTLNGLSSRHVKVSSICPLSQLLVLISATKCSPSLCGVFGPLFSSLSRRRSLAAAHRYSCCCPCWGCRRGQLRSCSCQYWGVRVSTIDTHRCCTQPWPASQQGQQPNLGWPWAGEARSP